MRGVTKLDKMRHERITGITKVGVISRKVQEEAEVVWSCKEDMKEIGVRESRRRTELCGGDSSNTSTPREVG